MSVGRALRGAIMCVCECFETLFNDTRRFRMERPQPSAVRFTRRRAIGSRVVPNATRGALRSPSEREPTGDDVCARMCTSADEFEQERTAAHMSRHARARADGGERA